MGDIWKLLVVIVSSLYLFLSCHGTSNQILYNFPINNLLTCQVPNPAAGPQASMPEPRFRVPLQPGPTGTVWRPALSQFRLPVSGSPNQETLLNFLGTDFDSFFTSTTPPTDEPRLAAGRLTVESSGGDEVLFIEDPTVPPPGLAELDNDMQRATVLRWIRDQSLGDCPLTAEWIRLNDSYFPLYFSGSRCGGQGLSCSFPQGQTCEPDVGPGRLAYVPVLRWDCCWSYIEGGWNWECGWRKVDAPIIVGCHCGCQPRQRTDFK